VRELARHLRKLVARDLLDAAVPGLSADRTFATAYNAVLQLSKPALAAAGYRGGDRPYFLVNRKSQSGAPSMMVCVRCSLMR